MKQRLRVGYDFIFYVFKKFFTEGGPYRAAALTFTCLLSIVPLLAVSFSLLAAFPIFKKLSGPVQEFIFANFVPTTGETVQNYLMQFIQQASKLSAMGLVFLVITAILLMFTVEQAFNAIWRVGNRRKGVAIILLYWAILTLAPILLGAGMAVSSYLLSLPLFSKTAESLGVLQPILRSVPFFSALITFTLIYVAVPNCSVPLRFSFIGALISAILLFIAKVGFTFYISHFQTYTLLYGTLATLPIVLLWMYLFWFIVLIGAVIVYALSHPYQYQRHKKIEGFIHALRWLYYLWQAQQLGQSISLLKIIAKDGASYNVDPDEQLNYLLSSNLIKRMGSDSYVLCRDLSKLSLMEFYQLLPWRLPLREEIDNNKQDLDKALLLILNPLRELAKKDLSISLSDLFKKVSHE